MRVNQKDQIEIEADNFAESKLIDSDSWKTFYSKILRKEDVIEFSNQYCVSPAIISGRIQKKRNDYSIFRDLLGQGKVKDCFNRILLLLQKLLFALLGEFPHRYAAEVIDKDTSAVSVSNISPSSCAAALDTFII